jgi:hypothetical protein
MGGVFGPLLSPPSLTKFGAAVVSDVEKLATINADNARAVLADINCPCCGACETLGTFRHPNNNGVGIVCNACGVKHPLPPIMWLRQGENKPKRSNDIAAVIKECGDYCYSCGIDFEEFRRRRIGIHVHHTKSFAEHGEKFPKIPMCAVCHETLGALQRQMPKLLGLGD